MKVNQKKKPELLYQSPSILQKMIIDLPSKDLVKIISNDKKELEEVKKYTSKDKELSHLQFCLKTTEDLENTYEINNQIEKIEKEKYG